MTTNLWSHVYLYPFESFLFLKYADISPLSVACTRHSLSSPVLSASLSSAATAAGTRPAPVLAQSSDPIIVCIF